MLEIHPTQDVSVSAPDTKAKLLRGNACALLQQQRIAHIGWTETGAPFQQVRLQPSGSYIQVCIAGEGRIMLDGRWQASCPGMAALAPPRVLNAFEAIPGKRWHFCWVRFSEPMGTKSVVNATSPVIVQCNPAILYSAIQGLQAECEGAADPRFIIHWVELITGEVQRLAQPWQKNERLGGLWKQVEDTLSQDWTCDKLATRAGYSSEHLRRICLRELGRTPMQQVTYMRVHKAAETLLSGNLKLAEAAHEVGYSDAFVLSKLFKKWMGCSPSDYRSRSVANPRH
ncbi:MAG: AraC family transcriptional regulator [Verrucomicrobiota bacterium]